MISACQQSTCYVHAILNSNMVSGEREKDAGAVDEEVVTVEPQLKKNCFLRTACK